ncbi:GAF and ANTAR domain-containing protein [Arthrobacter agilis]|uniref:GAF and ANTAR domain-containing protein n=1 Tax=Arthrobacter agilis TaxID=37921 RepID=UPI00277D636A|nr:GAF and ANTAR domain-containing protein [Arthrobacter agilis]MDQ0736301.1 GAF domain-containing protein [Arthrobacter agilis]
MPTSSSRRPAIDAQALSDELQDLVLDSGDIGTLLTLLAEQAAAEFATSTQNVLCGVTLLRPRKKLTIASSSARAQQVDEVQYRFDDGPCLRAARTGHAQYVADFRTDTRFGGYSTAVRRLGVLSALGTPIPLDGDAKAALDLYAEHPDAFDDETLAAVQDMATGASKALRLAVRLAQVTDTNHDLMTAMDSRTAILLAAGVIMGQNRCSHEDAMRILRSASSSRNVKLHDVAAHVLASIDQQVPETHFQS